MTFQESPKIGKTWKSQKTRSSQIYTKSTQFNYNLFARFFGTRSEVKTDQLEWSQSQVLDSRNEW